MLFGHSAIKQESFDKSFLVRKCHFVAAFKHWNVSSPKFGKIASPDDIWKEEEIKLRERSWISPRCGKPTFQPQSGQWKLSRGLSPFPGECSHYEPSLGALSEFCFVFGGKVVDCIRMHTETNFETRRSLIKQNSNFPVTPPCYTLSSAELNEKGSSIL